MEVLAQLGQALVTVWTGLIIVLSIVVALETGVWVFECFGELLDRWMFGDEE